jgi:kynureninase
MLDRSVFERLVGLDAADPLQDRRHLFHLPQGITYLDGNSLGCLPHSARRRADQAVAKEWGEGLIRSWLGAQWLTLPGRVGDRIGRLIGAAVGQIVATDSTSITLYKVLNAALDLQPKRLTILTDQDNFPTDLYILDSVAQQRNCRVRRVRQDDVAAEIDDTVAVVALTHVDYKSAAIYDMPGITAKAHAVGALTIWDLAHTAGAIPCDVDGCQVDFAVGCGYKYLNGGPGAPAFLYVAKRHQHAARQPLHGWFGHRAPFDFSPSYDPAVGIARFLSGTPSVVALSALDGALDVFEGVELATLREKSRRMVSEFLALFDAHLVSRGFVLASERDPKRRGSHISFSHPQGYRIMRALADRGIIGDFRAPDVLRFGFAPLYNRFADVGTLIEATLEVMEAGTWQREEYGVRQAVT